MGGVNSLLLNTFANDLTRQNKQRHLNKHKEEAKRAYQT